MTGVHKAFSREATSLDLAGRSDRRRQRQHRFSRPAPSTTQVPHHPPCDRIHPVSHRLRQRGGRPVDWMDEIASEPVLQQAYAWLCDRRRDHSPNDDVWDLRWRWEEIRPQLQARLRAGGIASVRFAASTTATRPSRSGRRWMPWCSRRPPSSSPPTGCRTSRRTATTCKGGAGRKPPSGSCTSISPPTRSSSAPT